jgi:hypothetical protein
LYGVVALVVRDACSPQLETILKAHNYSLGVLPPALDGRAVAQTSAATLLSFVKVPCIHQATLSTSFNLGLLIDALLLLLLHRTTPMRSAT